MFDMGFKDSKYLKKYVLHYINLKLERTIIYKWIFVSIKRGRKRDDIVILFKRSSVKKLNFVMSCIQYTFVANHFRECCLFLLRFFILFLNFEEEKKNVKLHSVILNTRKYCKMYVRPRKHYLTPTN